MGKRGLWLKLLIILIISVPVMAKIDGNTGDLVILIEPPVSIREEQLESNTEIPVFVERTHHKLGIIPLPLDITATGITINGTSLSTGSVPGFSYINSHYLHIDSKRDERIRLHGSVTFEEDILGLIVLESTLEETDERLRHADVQYPPITLLEDSGRGLEINGTTGDWVFISEDRRTLLVSLVTKNKIDQLRIITTASPDAGGDRGEACTGVESAMLDIVPGNDENIISEDKDGIIAAVVYSREDFNAPDCVFVETLTFGRTGDELSLIHCGYVDHNEDGFIDIQCDFDSIISGFKVGDTTGTLKGRTYNGVAFELVDDVIVRAARHSRIICCTSPATARMQGNGIVFSSSVPGTQAVKLDVYNIVGTKIFESKYALGQHLRWNLRDGSGTPVANGVYLYVLTHRGSDGVFRLSQVQKIAVLR